MPTSHSPLLRTAAAAAAIEAVVVLKNSVGNNQRAVILNSARLLRRHEVCRGILYDIYVSESQLGVRIAAGRINATAGCRPIGAVRAVVGSGRCSECLRPKYPASVSTAAQTACEHSPPHPQSHNRFFHSRFQMVHQPSILG